MQAARHDDDDDDDFAGAGKKIRKPQSGFIRWIVKEKSDTN